MLLQSIYAYIQAFIQPKFLARLDWDSARGNALKLPILYYLYGSICKFSRAWMKPCVHSSNSNVVTMPTTCSRPNVEMVAFIYILIYLTIYLFHLLITEHTHTHTNLNLSYKTHRRREPIASITFKLLR